MENNEVIDYNQFSRIKVDSQDDKIMNQDARKVYVAKGSGEYKRTSDFMLGNDKKNLSNGEYVSVDEFISSVSEVLNNNEKSEVIVMKKTGKKLSNDNLKEIIKNAKKAGVIVLEKNNKIKNQDGRTVSVHTNNMDSSKKVAGMFLGKDGVNLSNGEYAKKDELEFEVISKEVVPITQIISSDNTKENKIDSKKIKLMKGLVTVAVTGGLIALMPWIMHANSVLWHQSPEFLQDILHSINLGLGSLIKASYTTGNGLWTSAQNVAMNSDSATSSLAMALATYGLTAAGLAKIVSDIKSGILTITSYNKNNSDEIKNELVEGRTI